MPRLLVVHHSPSASMRALTDAVVAGATVPELAEVQVVVRPALATTAEDLLEADAYVLGTPANFGFMSGALKHVFDTHFLAIGGALDPGGAAGAADGSTTGRLWGLYVHGRYDTAGAVRSVQAIVGGLGWRPGSEVLEVLGDVDEAALARAAELGGTLAALLTL